MILSFLLKKLRAQFINLKTPFSIVMSIVLLLVTISYGFLLGEIVQKLQTTSKLPITVLDFLNYTLLAIFVFSVVRMILPSYTPMRQFFPKYYPLSTFQRYIFSIISDYISPFFFFISLFLITAYFRLDIYKIEFLLSGFVVLISTQLIRRLIQYCIDFKLELYGYLAALIMISIIAFVIYTNSNLVLYSDEKGLFIILLLLLSGYLAESFIIESRQSVVSNKTQWGNIYWKLLFNNKKARLLLIIAFVFKFGVLGLAVYSAQSSGKNLFEEQFVFLIFIPPTVLFTYVFDNLFGFWKNVWLNYELRLGDYKEIKIISLKILAIPLSIDLILTFILILFTKVDLNFVLAYYFASNWMLVSLSFVISFFPVIVRGAFNMKGNTSQAGNFIVLGVVSLLLTIKLSFWFYLLVPLYIAISIILFVISDKWYQKRKYVIAQKLLN